MNDLGQGYHDARQAVEEDRLRKQLAMETGSALYGAWGEHQNLKTKEFMDKTFKIGGEDVPMYERKGNWFSDLFTGAKGRVQLSPEARKVQNYGQSFELLQLVLI